MDVALVLIVAVAGLVVSLCCIAGAGLYVTHLRMRARAANRALLRALDDAVIRLHTTKG
jgi:hypothetical protein